MSEIWQTISLLESGAGNVGLGLDTQSVLWSDASVFANHSEAAGNALMYAITERATQMVKGKSFTTPIELQEAILDDVFEYAKKVIDSINTACFCLSYGLRICTNGFDGGG